MCVISVALTIGIIILSIISGNDLRLRNTKEFLLKSNSERLIHERKRREKQYELEMKKSMNSNMKNYLDNIRKNISYT